jgi:predicted DNA-binding transcriptional regulator YafY
LKKYSDKNHPLTQEDIIYRLKNDYGIIIERKAVSRNFSLLREAGYEIISSTKGSYLDSREFEDSEIRSLIDSVLSSKYITASHSNSLIERLSNLSNEHFKSYIKNAYSVNEWGKTDNQEVFYTIDTINEAIMLDKKITFDYNKYGKDKKLHKISSYTVSPYQLILHNQRYFLMDKGEKSEDISYFRLDRITNIKIEISPLVRINTLKGYERGIDYKEIATKPFMFSDKAERIEIMADVSIIDDIIDAFGKEIQISDTGNGGCKVNLRSSVMAMEHYAMQYIDQIEIIKPLALRQKIKKKLQNNINKYGD